LKLGGRANLKLFSKDQATTYWFEENEVREVLEKIGFQILEVKKDNMLYVVCRK
jgi:ribonucleotide monophosphatase NagD (HAD superfamily)